MSAEAREIRAALCDPRALCETLGLLGGKGTFRSQGARGVSVRCVWHQEKTPSLSITRAADGTIRAKCFGCDRGGDALDVVAAVLGLNTKSDFRAVLVEAARMAGLHALAVEIDRGIHGVRPAYIAPPAAPPDDRTYPPSDQLARLLDECVPVTEDALVAAHLESRGLDPEMVADDRLALALPKVAWCPAWARFSGADWTKTGHRMLLPVRDAQGAVRSVRAWRVTDGDTPKRLPPGGHRITGLVLACPLAQAWLAGTKRPDRLLIAEGEPDFLAVATQRLSRPHARIAVWSGAWSPAFSQRCHAGLDVLVFTDRDAAGDRYAMEIEQSIAPRGCRIRRWKQDAA